MTKVEFTIEGHNGFAELSDEPANGNPWAWRAEFFSAFDTADRALAAKGWARAYIGVSDMFGNPESIRLMKLFHDAVVEKCGLSPRADIFGFSRGGLYTVNYAAAYPEDVSTIYLDAPVLDIRSWPGGFGVAPREDGEWEKCKQCYGLTDETAKTFAGNPLDKIELLRKYDTPCMLVAGGADKTVDYRENGKRFADAYKLLCGKISVIVKPNCDHHPHSLDDPTPIVEFIEKYRRY